MFSDYLQIALQKNGIALCPLLSLFSKRLQTFLVNVTTKLYRTLRSISSGLNVVMGSHTYSCWHLPK